MIRSFRGIAPKVALSAYVDPSAQVIGDVEIGERSSVWPNASRRGNSPAAEKAWRNTSRKRVSPRKSRDQSSQRTARLGAPRDRRLESRRIGGARGISRLQLSRTWHADL